jgi:hypothetical protein
MGAGDRRDLKRKLQATASVRRGILARKKEATASPSQGFGILKKRKEAMAAQDLLELEDVPGGFDTWMDRWLEMKAKMEEEEARPAKRKRVHKQRFPKALIDHLVACPFRNTQDLTPLQLSKRSHKYRQFHALSKFVDGKMRDYEQALIDQYNAQGYAEDEREVTDNEEDDVTAEN